MADERELRIPEWMATPGHRARLIDSGWYETREAGGVSYWGRADDPAYWDVPPGPSPDECAGRAEEAAVRRHRASPGLISFFCLGGDHPGCVGLFCSCARHNNPSAPCWGAAG